MLKALMMFLIKSNTHKSLATAGKQTSHRPPEQPRLNYLPILHYVIPSPRLHFVYVWMHLKCERLLQQRGKRKGDQPAHVERHGCSLMWLQLGSPGPNEVLWSSAAPSLHRLHTSSPHTATAAPFRIIKEMLPNSSREPE